MNFVLGPAHPLYPRNITEVDLPLEERSNTNYNQDYITGGSVSYSPGTNEFSVTWNTQEDFVVGVGWKPGSTSPITYSGSFQVNSGLGSLSVYGWSTNPLVEYYVMENQVDLSTGGTQKGTFTSDGGTYAVWENQRVNEPSIEGTSTFNQYISIRQSPRTSGTVTLENHFNAWASYGMNLGTLDYQVLAVESWSGSGSASQQVSN
ncbi:concanavalin A-like lectin/glucanase domain-containing protein [Xylariaceae sp. FL0255]|nr:concanavalin A-like lectin/glucanase domain-containing protein [Xylariaceae sp. FL0255]